MIDVLLAALAELASLERIAFMALGVVLGLIVGVFPGIGGIAGLSLLIPFIYGLDQISALAMLIGLVAVTPTGDTFSSILLGIPGSSASQATVLDGFPLARRGEAARALSAAFMSSLIGGIFGAIVLTGFVLIAKPLILAFGSAELFMLSVLGLSMVGVLSGRSLTKGLAACGLGLILGSIGGAPATGEFRLVFDIDYLYDGIPLVIVGLGLFAIPEITDLIRRDDPIASEAKLGRGWVQGARDCVDNVGLNLRCSGIGCIIGAIPGIGGSVVDWIAYGHAVQTSKDKSQYGNGDIRGVIAPESANNATAGGALLPTLMFGIPGSGSMAVFLGGMALVGLEPGPSMVTTDLHITYAIVWSLALANVMGAGICYALAQPIARLTLVPFPILAPFLIAVICFAAFQATRDVADLIALLLLGGVGILMKRFGWSRPAMLIGFVLAPQAENYLYQAVQFYDWGFLMRPGVLIIGAITALSVWFGVQNRVDDTGTTIPGQATPAANPAVAAFARRPVLAERGPQIAFAVLVIAVFGVAIWDASGLSTLGAVFPLTSFAVTGLFALLLLGVLIIGESIHPAVFDAETEARTDDSVGSLWGGASWTVGLVVGSTLIGFFASMLLFFIVFLRVRARQTWLMTAVYTAGNAIFMLVLADGLNLNFPRGALQEMVDLPWPFR